MDKLTQPDRRAQRRAHRREQNRTDILDAAEQVFGACGIYDGSLRKIADRSGFSPAAIYLFFDNKQHLLAEVLTRRSDELIQIARASSTWNVSPLEKLHRFIDVAIEYFTARPHFRLLLQHIRGGPTITWPVLAEFAEEVHRRYLNAMDVLADIIREGQGTGEIRGGDPRALAQLYTTLINEFLLLAYDANRAGNGTLAPEEFHSLIDGALRSAGAP